jgi:hypothetical protein
MLRLDGDDRRPIAHEDLPNIAAQRSPPRSIFCAGIKSCRTSARSADPGVYLRMRPRRVLVDGFSALDARRWPAWLGRLYR